ncbi:MAG: hypothetical protein ABIP36_02675 [Acidimicrobiales bacterium]
MGVNLRHTNERLDHLQADHPFLSNLGTGLLIGLILKLFGFAWIWVIAYALSWALLRAFLWGEGRILRRQYDIRVARVAEQQAAKRRQT